MTSSASATTSVGGSASSVQLVALNATRRELVIQNDSASVLYVKFGTTATTSDYTVKLLTDDILITEYEGRVDGIWTSATGNARITELNP